MQLTLHSPIPPHLDKELFGGLALMVEAVPGEVSGGVVSRKGGTLLYLGR